MLATRSLTLISLVTLAACSGFEAAERQSYADLFAEFNAIDAKFDRGNTDTVSDPTMLPTAGSFTYNGVLGANLPAAGGGTTGLIGDMTLTANFQNSQISGNVTDFVDSTEQEYVGTLDITNGTIFRTAIVADEFTFGADLDGQLFDENGGNFTVDARMRGDFYGPNEEYVGGDLAGTIGTPGGDVDFDGDGTYFVGKR